MDFIEELRWRGMLHQMTPGTEEKLASGPIIGYCGFDPSADSLQVGNLAAIMLMKQFQKAGHKPIALVGGATGIIGDPSGKSEERNLLTAEETEYNLSRFKIQLQKFLDFDCGSNSAEIVNNYDWFSQISYLDFLRTVGKHLTINYMMAKESVKNRLESGISYTEFSYQLLQGYDFVHLIKTKNCCLQFGGSDQWGNITSGTELVRRMGAGEAYGITAPLVTRADGTKFGKSAAGQKLWLDPEKTTPYEFYQFWINVEDSVVERYIKVFTMLSKEEISALVVEHEKAPHLRTLQYRLAKEVTTMVHSEEDYKIAVLTSEILFGNATTEAIEALSENEFLKIFAGVPRSKISRSTLQDGLPVVDCAIHCSELFPSKGATRRDIAGGALSINKQKITSVETDIDSAWLLNGKYLLFQKGKKNYFILEAE